MTKRLMSLLLSLMLVVSMTGITALAQDTCTCTLGEGVSGVTEHTPGCPLAAPNAPNTPPAAMAAGRATPVGSTFTAKIGLGSSQVDCTFKVLADNTVQVGNGNGAAVKHDTAGELTIPETVTNEGEEYTVTAVGNGAFWGCGSLTSIALPTGVKAIGQNAFLNCKALTNITIPNGVTTIGEGTFANCEALTSITLPAGVTAIGTSAFSGCGSLTTITLPDTVTTIKNSAFWGCGSLTSITLPDTVTTIGPNAFRDCTSLADITIPAGVTIIETYAFSGCKSLTDITIPAGVTAIGMNAFSGCKSLTDITIPDGVTTILDYAFSGCELITDITIPAGVTTIGNGIFKDCKSLTDITIPAGVATIGKYAFSGCKSLESLVFLGTTPPAIGEKVFDGIDTRLKVTVPKGTKKSYTTALKGINCYVVDGSESDDSDRGDPEGDFWAAAGRKVEAAAKGEVITVNASSNDNMPASIMRSIKGKGITLVIQWKGGKDIVLAYATCPTPEPNRISYTLADLALRHSGIAPAAETAMSNPETGGPQLTTTFRLPRVHTVIW